jgi:hypothetical protein
MAPEDASMETAFVSHLHGTINVSRGLSDIPAGCRIAADDRELARAADKSLRRQPMPTLICINRQQPGARRPWAWRLISG